MRPPTSIAPIHFNLPQTPPFERTFQATTGFAAIVLYEELMRPAIFYEAPAAGQWEFVRPKTKSTLSACSTDSQRGGIVF